MDNKRLYNFKTYEGVPVQDYYKSELANLYGFNSHQGFITFFEKYHPEIFLNLNKIGIVYKSASLRRLPAFIVKIFFDNSYTPILNERTKKIVERL